MFCSNCGKTLAADDVRCKHCGMPVGESRFDGHPYTGAQPVIHPAQAIFASGAEDKPLGSFYRTDELVGAESSTLDSDAMCGYRAVDDEREPLFNAQEEENKKEKIPAPKKQPENRPKAENVQEDSDGYSQSDLDELFSTSLEFDPGSGISDDVRRVMNGLRDDSELKVTKTKKIKKAKLDDTVVTDAPVDDYDLSEEADVEFEDESKSGNPFKKLFLKKRRRQEADEADNDDISLDDIDEDIPESELDPDDEDDIEDDMDEAERKSRLTHTLTIIAGAVLVIALVVGGIIGISYLSKKTQKSPIDGVSLDLYNEGIELMQTRVGESYRNKLMANYSTNNAASFVTLSSLMTQDLDGLDSLLPSNPQANDQRFINALKAIQENINNSITNDVLSLTDSSKTSEEKQAASDERWESVRQLVSVLSSATNSGMLDSIIKGERVEVISNTTPTPEPTATPEPYTTLSKGNTGARVTELQTRLTELGYLNDQIDGTYGNKTKTAVQLFQQKVGLEATGIADAQTQIALFADDAPAK